MAPERNPLAIGVRLQLRRTDDPEAGSYSTRVEDMDDERIAVQLPIVQRQPVTLPAGTPVQLEFVRSEAPGAGSYRAETVVLGRSMRPVPLLYLQAPQKWHRQQLREFFRVPAVLAAQVRPVTEDEAPWLMSKTRDIGGGGCQLVVAQSLPENQAVEGAIKLPDRRIAFKGGVRWLQELTDRAPGHWVVGIAFTDIHERDRDAIIRFAFRRQIELRMKGMA